MKSALVHSRLILAAVAAIALAVPAAFAQTPSTSSGQAFPSKPVELVVHTAPGGGTDIFARVVAEIVTREKLVSQPVNIFNRPGGGGAIAYTYIKSKRGDPHTVMTVASMALLSQTVRPELGLGLDNYTPLAFLAQDPQAVMVSVDSPHKTFKDLVDAARREPNSLAASITSPGGSGRLMVWIIERETGTRHKYAKHLAERRVLVQEFLQSIGIAPKP